MFIKHSDSRGIISLLVYVDHIIKTKDDEEEKLRLNRCLAKRVEIKELGNLKQFLVIKVAYSKSRMFISQ